jgi:hypothetical protein
VILHQEDWEASRFPNPDVVRNFRRRDGAIHVMYIGVELSLNIPDEAFYHPVVEEISDLVADLVVLENVSHQFFNATLRGG